MFCENLASLRKLKRMTQEQLAEKVGVSRQAVAKWETGESVPDLERSRQIAQVFGVSLDDLVNYSEENSVIKGAVPPKGKYIFGVVELGKDGEFKLPERALKVFDLKPGDNLVVLGDEGNGIALINEKSFFDLTDMIRKYKK
ncbi:MAG: helix-turn-helix transcriptional regulator [Clostridia bacterium]|nr:helix-turn-helix transcriptional regulator [Clostridia bacterium]